MLPSAGNTEWDAAAAVVTAADGSLSTNWHLSDVRALADVFAVSQDLMESMVKHISGGKSLLIPFRSHSVTAQAVTAADFDVHVSRAFTRCVAIHVNMQGPQSGTRLLHCKETTDFYSSNYNGGTILDTIEARLAIGDQQQPDTFINSTAQFYMRQLESIGIKDSSCHATSVSLDQYQGRESGAYQPAFNIIHDTEVTRHASQTGFNTSHGGLITAQVRNVGVGSSTYESKCYVVVMYDGVLELGLDSAAVLS